MDWPVAASHNTISMRFLSRLLPLIAIAILLPAASSAFNMKLMSQGGQPGEHKRWAGTAPAPGQTTRAELSHRHTDEGNELSMVPIAKPGHRSVDTGLQGPKAGTTGGGMFPTKHHHPGRNAQQ